MVLLEPDGRNTVEKGIRSRRFVAQLQVHLATQPPHPLGVHTLALPPQKHVDTPLAVTSLRHLNLHSPHGQQVLQVTRVPAVEQVAQLEELSGRAGRRRAQR